MSGPRARWILPLILLSTAGAASSVGAPTREQLLASLRARRAERLEARAARAANRLETRCWRSHIAKLP